MGIEFALSTPLDTGKATLDKLDVKRPTGRAFARHGVPFNNALTYHEDGSRTLALTYNATAMRGFICDMTGLDEIQVDSLDGYDLFNLYSVVREQIVNPPTRSL